MLYYYGKLLNYKDALDGGKLILSDDVMTSVRHAVVAGGVVLCMHNLLRVETYGHTVFSR